MEKHVTSLELSKKLKELGFPLNHITHPTYIKARDLILASEGRPWKYCRCPDPNHVKGNDNSPISLDRVLMALGEKYGIDCNGSLYLFLEINDKIVGSALCIIKIMDLYLFKLGKPLHLQSLETLEKIVEILEDNQK